MLIPFELELTSRISRFAGEWKLCAKLESCSESPLLREGNNILDSKILEPSSGKHVVAGFSPRYGAEVVATKTRALARDYTFRGPSKGGSLGALFLTCHNVQTAGGGLMTAANIPGAHRSCE